jgi:hypothetical protein
MYVQNNGVAMDASLAPVVVDNFMNNMEIGLWEWQRYIDNTFVLIEPTTNVAYVLSILNNFYPPHQIHK